MVKIGNHAPAGFVKGLDHRAVVVGIGIRTSEFACGIYLANQAIDALMVLRQAGAVSVVIRAPWRIGKRAEVVVKGMIFLHHDDDVIHFRQISIGEGVAWQKKGKEQGREQCSEEIAIHGASPRRSPLGGLEGRRRNYTRFRLHNLMNATVDLEYFTGVPYISNLGPIRFDLNS